MSVFNNRLAKFLKVVAFNTCEPVQASSRPPLGFCFNSPCVIPPFHPKSCSFKTNRCSVNVFWIEIGSHLLVWLCHCSMGWGIICYWDSRQYLHFLSLKSGGLHHLFHATGVNLSDLLAVQLRIVVKNKLRVSNSAASLEKNRIHHGFDEEASRGKSKTQRQGDKWKYLWKGWEEWRLWAQFPFSGQQILCHSRCLALVIRWWRTF